MKHLTNLSFIIIAVSSSTVLKTCQNGYTPPLPLSVVQLADTNDFNGKKQNPIWGYQFTHGMKGPDVSSIAFTGNVNNFVPGKTSFTADSIYIDPGKSHTVCPPPPSFIFGSECACNGVNGYAHVDWYPITYTGEIDWDGYSGCDDGFCDNDLNFTMYRTDSALATKVDGQNTIIKCEFDSKETTYMFMYSDDVWDSLNGYAYGGDDASCQKILGGRYAIVTGLFGVDCVHGCYSELHPVYAICVHLGGDSTSDRWAFIVRNWGNEGYCGTSQHFWRTNSVKVFIPKPGAINATITGTAKFYMDIDPSKGVGTSNQVAYSTTVVENQGAVLSFPLVAALDTMNLWEGEVTFHWKLSGSQYAKPLSNYPEYSKKPRAGSLPKITQNEEVYIDTAIMNRVNKLDPASQKEFGRRKNKLKAFDTLYAVRIDNSLINKAITTSKTFPPTNRTSDKVTIVPNTKNINHLNKQTLQILEALEKKK